MFKLIIADDERLIREALSATIDWKSHELELAGVCRNGIEAYDMILDESPDIVLTDIRMPGMDGLEAARLVVERYREAGRARPPIIATTANAYEEDRRRALDAGMDGFAVKHIGKSEACHLFATFVDAKIDE